MCRTPSLFLLVSLALPRGNDGSNTNGTRVTTFNTSGQLPSVVDGILVKRRLRANEPEDDEDRMNPRELFTALKDKFWGNRTPEELVAHHLRNVLARSEDTQRGSIEAALTRIKRASSSTAQAGDQEFSIRAAKKLISRVPYKRMVDTFRKIFGEEEYQERLFSGLCNIFGDEVMTKVLFHLEQEGGVSRPIRKKLWKSQFKYWRENDVSYDKAYGNLPKFDISEETRHFDDKVNMLDGYIKYRNHDKSNDLILFETLLNHHGAHFAELMLKADESETLQHRYFESLKSKNTRLEELVRDLHSKAGGVKLFEGHNYNLLSRYVDFSVSTTADRDAVMWLTLRSLFKSDEDFALHLAELTQRRDLMGQPARYLNALFSKWEQEESTHEFDQSTRWGQIVVELYFKYMGHPTEPVEKVVREAS
ncbi:hypothetical protein PsorP6_002955 [Peronosclerospora sorghi]|uniref:Uncharacterized protein n=1 Tax=Peronosclerospora sorghi TaxID=230839 RepID=A0ACC0VJ25_9STRA|nr:hypothetical protein PsorP6_002955 [Peronosclerospora sorghi]